MGCDGKMAGIQKVLNMGEHALGKCSNISEYA